MYIGYVNGKVRIKADDKVYEYLLGINVILLEYMSHVWRNIIDLRSNELGATQMRLSMTEYNTAWPSRAKLVTQYKFAQTRTTRGKAG